MKIIYSVLFLLFFLFTPFTFAQNIKFSKQDSLKLLKIPEIKIPSGYFNNRTALPTIVDNTQLPFWRGILWQGGCSCGQASSEGYVFTYEMSRKRNLDASIDANRYPYSFTYNFLNIGNTVCGASFLESQDIIREAGIPNIPTNEGQLSYGNFIKWLSGYDKYYAAMQNRINQVYAIHVGTPEGLTVLKHWLNDHLENASTGGMAFFYANHVNYPEELAEGTPEAGKHIITGFSNTSHSMTIVGYNDEVKFDYNNDGQYTNDIDITDDGLVDMRDWEIGAFKIANTYSGGVGGGPLNWSDSGFAYVMYRVLPYHNSVGGIWDKAAYVTDVKENYAPLLTAKVNLTYNSRDKIKVMAGVSSDLSSTFPEFVKEFPHFRFQGDALYMQGGTEDEDKTIEFGLDLTELLNYIEPDQDAKYFLYIKEMDEQNIGTGTVNSFSIIDYTNGVNEFISSQSYIPITNNGNTLLSVDANLNYSDIEIVSDTVAKAELNNAYSAQIEAEGGSEPYQWHPFYDYHITSVANTLIPITSANLPHTFQNVSFDFEFPFYGKKYQMGTVSKYGTLMFENEDANVPYDRDYSVLMRYFKSIAPFHGESFNTAMKYEGNSNYAKFYWIANFDEIQMQYMVTIFPNGTIYIDYGNQTSPSNPEWSAGISKGDQISYQEFDFSGKTFPSNTRLILEPRPFPTGLNIDDNGLISGTLTEEFVSDSIFVKVIDNNWLTDIKGFLFTNRGLLFSNYEFETPNNNTLEYGETAQLSLTLSNVGEASINNIQIELMDNDPNYTLIDSTFNIDVLEIGEVLTLENIFEIEISEQIPDHTLISIILNVESNETTASDTVFFVARAPKIEVVHTEFIDNEDNILDPGEPGTVNIYYKNTGGSQITNLTANLTSTDDYLSINSISNNTKLLLEIDSTWMVSTYITTDLSTPEGFVSEISSVIEGDNSFHYENDVYIGIGQVIENWETGTTSSFPWGFDNDPIWFVDTNMVYEGTYAIRSAEIEDNQISVLSLIGTVAANGNISFHKRISSESNYDFLKFYIDSVEVGAWSGEVSWSESTFPITYGFHCFEWRYEKDHSVSSEQDAAWIDYIVFPALNFSSPEMQLSSLSFEKTMDPNQTCTDTLSIGNLGGGILNYTASIDNATLSEEPTIVQDTPQNRSVEGSSLEAIPNSVFTGFQVVVDFTIFALSPDNEYIEGLTINFPLGVQLDSASNFIGGSGGDMAWDTTYGNGSNVHWFGEQENGYGVLHYDESATARLYMTIDPAFESTIVLQYIIEGEVYGAEPHTITDYLVLNNNGTNTTWLTLDNVDGNLTLNQNKDLLLNFNTFGIPVGNYDCNIHLNSNIDSISVPITLHVSDGTSIKEFKNSIVVYPNPAQQAFNIVNPTLGPSKLEVFDLTGKIVFETSFTNKNTSIDCQTWLRGIYLIVIHSENKVFTEQLIIE